MTDRPLRAAVVQMEAVHEEVVPSVFHALRANGVEVTAFLNQRILGKGDLFSALTPYGDLVQYVPMETPQAWDTLAAQLREYDVLVMNTFQREGQAHLVRRVGRPAIGVVHNPRIVLDEPACREVIASGQLIPMTLADHVTSVLMGDDPHLFAETGTLTAWMWDLPEAVLPPRPERRRITIPGAVDFRNREYPLVLDTIPGLLETVGRDAFEIAVVGGGPDRERLHELVAERGLEDVFWFAPLDDNGFVTSEVFYTELARSTFLLPLLPETRRDYRLWKITASVSSSLGFKVPAILDRWTALVYDLPSVRYPAGQLADGLRRAVTMADDELGELQDELLARRTELIERSAAEMGRALDTVLSRPKAEPPADRDDREAFLEFAASVLPHSYSQRLQDLFALWHNPTSSGYFIEFGALDGRDFSNTYALERLGWDGVVAEPQPRYAEPLRANRSCYVSTKCVFDATGDTVTLRVVKDRPGLSSIEGFGEGDDKQELRKEYTEHEIETITLEDLLVEAGAPQVIDFLSIDTEGSELRILEAFDFERFHLRTIAVEHNEHQKQALFDLLSSKGYRRVWEDISGHDNWYVHESAYEQSWDLDSLRLARMLSDVAPFERRYFERRDLVAALLPEGATPPPAEVPKRAKYGARHPKWQGLDAAVDYTFLKRFHEQLRTSSRLPSDALSRRVAKAFATLAKRLEPTVTLEVGAAEATAGVRLDDATTVTSDDRVVVSIDSEGATEACLKGARHVLSLALAVKVDVGTATPAADGQWGDTDVVRYFNELGFTLVLCDATAEDRVSLGFVRNDVARRPWVARVAGRVYRPAGGGKGGGKPQPAPSLARRVGRKLKGR